MQPITYLCTMEKKKKNNVGFLVAMMVLVGFPMLAMYYMNKGVNYRKNLFKQFDDYGQIEKISNNSKSLDDKVILIFLVDGSDAAKQALTKMHSQFDNRKDVIFVVGGQHSILDTAQVWDLMPSGKEILAKALNESANELDGSGFLMDRKGHLRKRYDLSNQEDIELFVRQVALLLPPKKTPKTELKREIEK